MKQHRIEMILRADQPIAHHSETIGNAALAQREGVRQPDGSIVAVPIITGDSMRHGMRESSTYAFLDALGYPELGEPALRLLFNGGASPGSSGALKLGDYRELVEMVPTMALFGGNSLNRTLPGRIFADEALLVCEETTHLLPEWVGEYMAASGQELMSCRAYVEEVQRVRMDASLDPGKRKLLSAGAREGVEQRLLRSENSSEAEDGAAAEKEKSMMMPRRFERIVRGSLFFWRVTATTFDALEEDTLWTAILSFAMNIVVGGKKGTGHGRLSVIHARDLELARPSEAVEFALATREQAKGRIFRDHVRANADRIKTYLETVSA